MIFIIVLLNIDTGNLVQEFLSFSSHDQSPHVMHLKVYQSLSIFLLNCLLTSCSSFKDLIFSKLDDNNTHHWSSLLHISMTFISSQWHQNNFHEHCVQGLLHLGPYLYFQPDSSPPTLCSGHFKQHISSFKSYVPLFISVPLANHLLLPSSFSF